MPVTSSPFFGISYGWTTGEAGWGDPVNTNFQVMSFLDKGAVDAFVSSLPPSPTNGYSVVNTTDKQIYVRFGTQWIFIGPSRGIELTNLTDNTKYQFDGSNWVVVTKVLSSTFNTAIKNSLSVVVKSIADLKALDKTVYNTATALGYYTQGDGGGGNYWFDSTDTTSADNKGSIIVASDGGRWKLAKINEISVKQFGAKGDDATNDYVAIQAALDYMVSTGGGILFFPVGKYRSNTTLILNGTGTNQNSSNLVIKGAGMLVTYIDFVGAGVGTDGLQINGASRWILDGLSIKNAKNFGINMNAGINPGGITYVSRTTMKNMIVDGSTSHGIRFANTYMTEIEGIESRNNGGYGFYFEGNHTSTTAIRCWAGGDQAAPNGGNALGGWFLNGLIYSTFIGSAADNNGGAGWRISNCAAVSLKNCGSESNQQDGYFIVASAANNAGVPATGIRGVSLDGSLGFNNSLSSANSFANHTRILTADTLPAAVAMNSCTDILFGTQTLSMVFNGASGTVTVSENSPSILGTYTYAGTVVNGDYLTQLRASGNSLTSTVPITAGAAPVSITLPVGDWDVWGIADFSPAATTSITNITAGISTVNNTFGGQDSFVANRFAAVVPNATMQLNSPIVRIRSNGTTVVYLIVASTFTVSTMQAFGSIFARRAK